MNVVWHINIWFSPSCVFYVWIMPCSDLMFCKYTWSKFLSRNVDLNFRISSNRQLFVDFSSCCFGDVEHFYNWIVINQRPLMATKKNHTIYEPSSKLLIRKRRLWKQILNRHKNVRQLLAGYSCQIRTSRKFCRIRIIITWVLVNDYHLSTC